MTYNAIVGNPPYGKDTVGSNKKMHFQIMKNALKVCDDSLCFIMPSKCLYDLSLREEREMLKSAVCEHIEIIDKSMFPNTQMPETAIYACRKSGIEYSEKLDIMDKIISNNIEQKIIRIFDTKDTMFNYTIRIDGKVDIESIRKLYYKIYDYSYFLNLSYANFASDGNWFAQQELKNIGVLNLKDEQDFIKNNDTPKFVLGFKTFESASNVYTLLNGNLMKFCLWITQDDRNMKKKVYRLFPDLDYENIHSESELLKELGCGQDEQNEILNYVNNFNFTNKRNNRCLKKKF